MRKLLVSGEIPENIRDAFDFTSQEVKNKKLVIKKICQKCKKEKWMRVNDIRTALKNNSLAALCHLCSSSKNGTKTIEIAHKKNLKKIDFKKCETCKKSFRPRPNAVGRFCSNKCKWNGSCGEKSPNWRGGILKTDQGYIHKYAPSHPYTVNGYVLEHRLVMEEKLQRYLFDHENIHHKNGQRDDNHIENLELWSTSQPSGQRVDDKIEWMIQFLDQYGYDVLKRGG